MLEFKRKKCRTCGVRFECIEYCLPGEKLEACSEYLCYCPDHIRSEYPTFRCVTRPVGHKKKSGWIQDEQ